VSNSNSFIYHKEKSENIFRIEILLNNTEELLMKKQTKSILQELNTYANNRDVELIIESRALNVINSAIHILEMARDNFDPETALDLERRLLNSIRGADPDKFRRGIRRIQEQKRSKSRLARLDEQSDDK
jgi:hypothetical protein